MTGPKVLMVASTGGHLAQLHRLADRVAPPGARVWVTFDTPQSRALLAGERTYFVPYTAPRDYRNVAGNVRRAHRILRREAPAQVVSTGSGIALSFLPLARAMGLRAAYVESAARSEGPSLTGRIVERVPGVGLHTQYPSWDRPGWSHAGSVFDAFAPEAGGEPRPLARVVVTLGTIPYAFPRLLDACLRAIPPGAEVVWQTGATDAGGRPIEARAAMAPSELAAAMAAADVVIAHAGIGSALAALEAGRCPILVAREAAHGEHVDDHQRQIAAELDRRGLALRRSPGELTAADLRIAAGRRVQERSGLRPLPL